MTTRLRLILVALIALIVATPGVHADATPPIKLDFNSYDSMTVADCLRVMSMETGDVILPDASVNGFVGTIHITEDSVPNALDYLKAFEPGLTYQVVYYPNGPDEPDGEQLYQQIQQLKAFTIDGVVLPASGDDKTMLTFREDRYSTPDFQAKAIAGMREIYLVSDPTIRAQMNKVSSSTTAAALQLSSNPTQFNATLTALVQQIAKMTARQQIAAMGALAAAQRQINLSLDPSVYASLRSRTPPRLAVPVGSSGQRVTE